MIPVSILTSEALADLPNEHLLFRLSTLRQAKHDLVQQIAEYRMHPGHRAPDWALRAEAAVKEIGDVLRQSQAEGYRRLAEWKKRGKAA